MKSTLKNFRDPLLCTDASVVGFYEREFYMFSNFSSFQVEWRGHVWPTSEHAYQASRFFESDISLFHRVRQSRSAYDAYKIAQANKSAQIANWNDTKTSVMYDICKHKLMQHDYIQH